MRGLVAVSYAETVTVPTPVLPAPRTIVEACFDSEGKADLGLVYGVASVLGVGDQPVRLAIRRIEAAGLAKQLGRGRSGTLLRTVPNPYPDPVSAGRLRRARAFANGELRWDGKWRLTSFSFADGRRAERDALRAALAKLGCVPIAPALYLSTGDPRVPLQHYASSPARDLTGELIVAEVTSLDIAGVRETGDIVERFWDFSEVLAAYERADRAISADHGPAASADPVGHAAAALLLSEPFALALGRDPLLPPELLPGDWPPRRVHERFTDTWKRYARSGSDIELYRLYRPEV